MGATWTEQSPSSAPSARTGGMMTYDSTHKLSILFGGTAVTGGANLNDTWSYDSTTDTWTQFTPSTSPSVRYYSSFSFDPLTGLCVLFGGTDSDSTAYGDTWTFNAGTGEWTQVSPSTPPSARYGASMAFDVASNTNILFGGYAGGDTGTLYNDTWSFDSSSGQWTELTPSTPPPTRYGAGMVYDSVDDLLILFGGLQTVFTVIYNDTWVYSSSSNTWTQMNPTTYPSIRFFMGMTFDTALGGTFLFGGTNYNDTWTYTYSTDTWTQQSPVTSPATVTAPQMCFDSSTNLSILFHNNTWTLTRAQAPNAPTLTVPAPSSYVPSPSLFSAIYNSNDASSTSARAMRLKLSGATSYSYFNASTNAFQSTVVWNSIAISPGSTGSFTVPAQANGYTYNWSMQDQEGILNYQGPFAADATVTAQASASLAINAPVGSITNTAAPSLSYSPLPAPGLQITGGRWLIYPLAITQEAGFSIDIGTNSIPTGYVSSVSWQSNPLTVAMQPNVILNQNAPYVAYVAVTETGNSWSPTVASNFTIAMDAPALPLISVSDSTDPTTGYPVLEINVTAQDNLLSTVDASFETGVGAWTSANATLGTTTAWAFDGLSSLSVECVSTGAITALSPQVSITPGDQYLFTATLHPISTAEPVDLIARWYTSGGTLISTTTLQTLTEQSGATVFYGWLTAPATASTAQLLVQVLAATGELAAPTLTALTTATTGGSIAASITRDYTVTALNAYGTTLSNTPLSATTGTTTNTNANTLTWDAVSGATSYAIYASQGGSLTQQATTTALTYTDTAATLSTGSSLPTVNTSGETHCIDRAGIFPSSAPTHPNLIWDSDLLMATNTVYPSWSISQPAGSSPGELGVINAGTPQAAFVLQGDGTDTTAHNFTTNVFLENGFTYTLSAYMDASALESGGIQFGFPNLSQVLTQAAGTKGMLSLQFTGDGTWQELEGIPTTTPISLATGSIVSWSQLQLTNTSTLQPYSSGPMWTRGGLSGATVATILRSDGVYVRNASPANPLTLTANTGQVLDYEVIPTVPYAYTAFIQIQIAAGEILSSPGMLSSSVSATSTQWWEIDPTNPSSAINAQLTQFNPQVTEQSAAHMVTGQSTLNIIANAMGGTDGAMTFETFTTEIYNGLQLLLQSQKTLFFSDPFGDQYGVTYGRIGPQSGGMSTGMGNKTKSAQLQPSTSAAPYRVVDVTFVAQPRPTV